MNKVVPPLIGRKKRRAPENPRPPFGGYTGSMAKIIDTVKQRERETSLRQVAREVGMSPTGMRKVLDGTYLHNGTQNKLRSWYVRTESKNVADAAIDTETARMAINLLFVGLPPGRKRIGMARVVNVAREQYSSFGYPEWVNALSHELLEADKSHG
jgi:hypothetical protein